jgi:hypothetical protein
VSQVIADYRAKNPQYDEVPDEKLVPALHNKYYSTMPIEEFTQKIGYQPIQADPIQQEMPDQIDQGIQQPIQQDQTIDAYSGAAMPAQQEKPMMQLIGEKLTNLGAGLGERAGDLGGALLKTIETTGRGLEQKLPMGGFIWEDGDILPSYKTPEEFAKADAPAILQKGASVLEGIDLGYQQQVGWEDVKKSFSEGGPLSGSAYADVLEFGLEQGVKSVPDMVAAIYALPTYVFARSGEIGEERAKNKGKEQTELVDVLEAAPFAVASSLLERIGAKGMTSAAKEQLGKNMLKAGIKESTKRVAKAGSKALTKEAATEAIQEGMLEYVGERYGTKAELDYKEALDRAAAGAVGGGVFGGAVGTTTALGNEINYSPEKAFAKSLERDIKAAEPTGMEQQAIESMKPEQSQYEVITEPAMEAAKQEAGPSYSATLDLTEKENQDAQAEADIAKEQKQKAIDKPKMPDEAASVPVKKSPVIESDQTFVDGQDSLLGDQKVTDKKEGSKLTQMPEKVMYGPSSYKTKPITGDLYRESSVESLSDLLWNALANTPEKGSPKPLFVADSKDIAIGQGKNKGIMIELDGNLVSGEIVNKPGMVEGLTSKEYKTDFIGRDAIKSFTLPKGVGLKGAARVMARDHFDVKKNNDGSVTYTRPDLLIKDKPVSDMTQEEINKELNLLSAAVRERMGSDASGMVDPNEVVNMTDAEKNRRFDLINALPSYGKEQAEAKERNKKRAQERKAKSNKWEKRSKRSWKSEDGQIIADLSIAGTPKLYMVFENQKEFDAGNNYATGQNFKEAKDLAEKAGKGQKEGSKKDASPKMVIPEPTVEQLEKQYEEDVKPIKAEYKTASQERKAELREESRKLRLPLDAARSKIIISESKKRIAESKKETKKAQQEEPVNTFTGTVYHQTSQNFEDFDTTKSADGTVWFTSDKANFSDPKSSASAAAGKGRIIERNVDLKKVAGFKELDKYTIDELISQGYDGAYLDGDIQVFDVKSIKPVGSSKKEPSTTESFSSAIKKNNTNTAFQIRERGDIVFLDKIVVPEGSREKGMGTKAMNDITRLADQRGKTISLNPSTDFGGNKKRLIEFYKGFGFVENKGKNKDYEISDSMYRLPQKTEGKSAYNYNDFVSYQQLIESSSATKKDINDSFNGLINNKERVISDLDSMTKKELIEFTKTKKTDTPKDELVTKAYEGMLEAHALKPHTIDVVTDGATFEEQIKQVVESQTEAEIKEAQLEMAITVGRKQDTPAQKARAKRIKSEKVPEILNSNRPASETGAVFHAPGHNYVGVYRSMGLPPRQDVITIDGKRIVMPSDPQRIEPIMRDLISIMGRRIYNGKIKGQSVEGFYNTRTGALRTRRKNDVEILAHEMAHYLDMYSNETLPNFSLLYKKKAYRDEVASLSYTDANAKIELIEGFAEFVRLWLTNSKEAKLRAPGFYDAFNDLLASDKKLNDRMKSLRESMHKFYFQGADHLGRALIGREEGMYGKFMQWTYRRDSLIRQQSIDKMHAAREAEKELTGQVGTVQESAWKQFRIANGGYEGIAEYIMNYGTLKFEENGDLVPSGKSLFEIFKPVDTIKLTDKDSDQQPIDLLMRYFAGRRALELHRQKRENLIPKETAKAWAKLGRDYPVFESIFKEYQAFNTRMMDLYQESGMLTPDARATMEKVNQDYVPFNRIRDSLSEGKGVSSGFHKLKGGTANLEDILVNIQDGVTANVKAALDARAKQRLYQYIANHRDGAIWAVKVAPDSKLVKTHLEDMERKIVEVLEASGVVIEGELDLSNPELLNFWQHGIKPTLTETGNFIDTVIVNGKPQYYEVQDPLLQEMLLSMNPESYSSFMNVMFGIKNLFTRSITLGVEFTGANLVRDTIGATFISKNNFTPFVDSFKGMYSYFRKDKYFQDFMRSGGGYSSRVHGSTKDQARQRVRIKQYGVANRTQKILSAIDNLMSAFEYGTRIGEFRLAKKNEMSDMDAAFAAREISTDFSVYGANHFLTGYIRTVPFLNAMIQSQDRIFREAFIYKKFGGNPRALAMKAFLGLTVPTLMLWLINKDDEDYKEIPDYEKRTNWHFPLGDGTFIKMPRPYDVGFVFATMPELFFKYVEDSDGKEYAEGMAWTMLQMYGIDGVPAAAQGMWDLLRNKKWTGAPVVPGSMADLSASQQYNANTSETFIKFGQMLNISPIKAEHFFKAHTGYLGGYLMAGTERMLWDEEKFGDMPESTLADNIFVKRFLTPEVRPNNRSMEKFFDLKEQSDQVTADFKAGIDVRRAIKGDLNGKFKDDTFYGLSGDEKTVLFALNDSMNNLIKIIYGKEGMKTKELSIRYDKKLSAEQKRNELDKLWTQRNSAFTRYYTQAKKALDKAKKLSEEAGIKDSRTAKDKI